MSFSRTTLKDFAKTELRLAYWPAFLVCLIGGLLGGYASGGSASIDLLLKRGPSQSGYGSYIYPSQWERAAYEMEYWADRAFHMVWLALPFVLLGLLIGLAYAALVANPLKVGMARYFTRTPQGERLASNLLWTFKSGYYANIVITMLFTSLIIWLGMLCFVIPGIVLSYVLRMVPYILAQEPWLTPSQVLRKSADMTRGDKWSIFVLDLSFLGWHLLGTLFFGIGGLFVSPYVEATFAQLYGALTYKTTGHDPYAATRF
jgi:hypothetical protein